jgi:hypothetical protein
MAETITSPVDWWAARRLRYNIGLIISGILAFIAYIAVGSMTPARNPDFEVTPFTMFFQGVGYLFMIGIANICYYLGPVSERIIRPSDPQRYRVICFRLGFWFSVLLPFGIPALVALK